MKVQQETALESLLDGKDVIVNLPTSFGKSLIFWVCTLSWWILWAYINMCFIYLVWIPLTNSVLHLEFSYIRRVTLCNTVLWVSLLLLLVRDHIKKFSGRGAMRASDYIITVISLWKWIILTVYIVTMPSSRAVVGNEMDISLTSHIYHLWVL